MSRTWQEACPECDWSSKPHPSPYPAMAETAKHFAETGHRRLPLDDADLQRLLGGDYT